MSLQQLLLAIRTGDVNSAWEVFNSSSNLQNLLDSSDTWVVILAAAHVNAM